MNLFSFRALAAAAALALAPSAALACACGCEVFDVGGKPLMASPQGGQVFLEYDYMDQTRNFSGAHGAPAADNDDKQIRSNFVVAGVQYMIDKDWGVMAEVPVTNRFFRTEEGGDGVHAFDHTAFGDVRLMGIYTGLSSDMSTGLIAGVKLPTGDWRYSGFDRDVAIGSGSTDLILGGYHVGSLSRDGAWSWFIQGQFDIPVAIQDHYRPGDEFDGAVGVTYAAWSSADGKFRLSPSLQAIGSARNRDRGAEADPENSGYGRFMISPGVQLDAGAWTLYGDVEFPVYQTVNGDQLVAPQLFKVTVSRRF
jgi:hypothetical protein